MRALAITLLLLAACDRNAGQQEPEVEAKPAQLSFEGADYKADAEKIAHGKRLAIVLDCTGCHGQNLQGTNLEDDPAYDAMYAPNITLLLPSYSDAELDKLIRNGVPRDGREFWFMPVESYQFLSDADLAALVTYLRTLKPAGRALPAFKLNAREYKDVEQGLLGNAQAQIRKYRANPPVDLGQQHAWGRYLAQTTCTICHNSHLQGWEGFTPDLTIASAFTPAELESLLTTGKGKSKPDLGLMKEIALRSLSKMTPSERQAVIAYVKARAERPQ